MTLKYHAQADGLVISTDILKQTAINILGSMKSIRELAGLPLDRYEMSVAMSPADHAQQRLVTLARDLGIDLGSQWANEIDLRDHSK